jgi:hypothetical protein
MVDGVPINSLAAFQSEKSDNLFVTVDDASSLKLWDSDKGQLLHEESRISKGSLNTCAIDEEG